MEPMSNYNPETGTFEPPTRDTSYEFEWFSKGYDAGIAEVLDAIATYVGQGGKITKTNVDKFISTYDVENLG